MKNQYSLKFIGALIALSGIGANVHAQAVHAPKKIHDVVNVLRSRAHIPSVTVGDTLKIHVHAAVADTFSLAISDTGGMVVQTALVTGGHTNLAALPIGHYSFVLSTLDSVKVSSGKFAVKAPHVHALIKSGTLGDTLSISVKAGSTESFTLAISDTSGVIQTLTVTGGKTDLPALPIGKYSYTLTDANGYVVNAGKFAVKAPRVLALIRSITLGDTAKIWVKADASASFTLAISDNSGVIQTLTVTGGSTDLPALPIGHYSYTLTNADGIVVNTGRFAVKAPKVHSHIHSVTSGETLSIVVRADSTESFTLAISDTSGVVQTLTVTGGSTDLPALPIGKYTYTLTNAAGIEVDKGRFDVKAPHVHADIHSGVLGDTLHIHVKAASSETFTLVISDTSGTAVQTLTVTGGKTNLPALAIGKYTYTLTNSDGVVVNKGRFDVKAPHVHAHILSSKYANVLSIVVLAPTTETFTLAIADTSGAVVQTAAVTGGTTALATLPAGHYTFTLVNADGIQVEKGHFVVHNPVVKTFVFPNPAPVGEGSIVVAASETQEFTLKIVDGASAPVYSGTVKGGVTPLPTTLAAGIYHYSVINADGVVVSKGRIVILL